VWFSLCMCFHTMSYHCGDKSMFAKSMVQLSFDGFFLNIFLSIVKIWEDVEFKII
jgi:hypothetical protein